MNSVLEKYFSSKEKELNKYINFISSIFTYKDIVNVENRSSVLKHIIEIYINNYYKVMYPSLEKVNSYFEFDDNTDIDYKIIMDSCVRYYESINREIINNSELIYMSHLVYFALLIDRLRDTIVIVPSKYDFIVSIARKVSLNFEYEKNDKFKDNMNELIDNIKENIKSYNKIVSYVNRFNNKDFYNSYIALSDEYSLYEIKVNNYIKSLKNYKHNDIEKIKKKENFDDIMLCIGYEYSQVMLLKCLFNDSRKTVAIRVNKDFYNKKTNVNNLLKLINSKYTSDYTKLIMNDDDYEECDSLNRFKECGVKVIIDSDDYESICNIKFDNQMVLLTSLEVINSHKSELESNNIKYIKRSDSRVLNEKELFITSNGMEV